MQNLDVSVESVKTKRTRVPGSRLKEAREAAKLSQEEMSKLLDVRLATISERENANDVSLETWIAWASVIGVEWRDEHPAKPKRPKAKRKPDA